MSKHKFVCFDCRQAVKRELYPKSDVLCSLCGKPCEYLGVKIPVPPKSKTKEWDGLRSQLENAAKERSEKETVRLVRRKHELEREIQKLESKPENPGRKSLINSLKRELELINA